MHTLCDLVNFVYSAAADHHKDRRRFEQTLGREPTTMASMSSDGNALVPGVVVWAKLEGFPWWPALIRERELHEQKLLPAERAVLPAYAGDSRMVEFFNDGNRVAVIKIRAMAEYSSNMELQTHSGEDKDVIDCAVEEADLYLRAAGVDFQRRARAIPFPPRARSLRRARGNDPTLPIKRRRPAMATNGVRVPPTGDEVSPLPGDAVCGASVAPVGDGVRDSTILRQQSGDVAPVSTVQPVAETGVNGAVPMGNLVRRANSVDTTRGASWVGEDVDLVTDGVGHLEDFASRLLHGLKSKRSLSAELAELRAETVALRRSNEELREVNAVLKNMNEEHAKMAQHLQRTCDALQKDATVYRKENAGLRDEGQSLRQGNMKLQRRWDELQKELTSMRDRRRELIRLIQAENKPPNGRPPQESENVNTPPPSSPLQPQATLPEKSQKPQNPPQCPQVENAHLQLPQLSLPQTPQAQTPQMQLPVVVETTVGSSSAVLVKKVDRPGLAQKQD